MKKTLSILSVMLMILSLHASAEVITEDSISFTHPEIGEFMTIKLVNGMPGFSIYDFPYYEIVDPEQGWRGIHANAVKLIHGKMLPLDQVLTKLFDSVEGLNGDEIPVDFFYAGSLEPYGDQLVALERKERVEALRILAGFEGPKAYKQLNKLQGFEDLDVKALEESHQEYTVRVGKKSYPYRVLMFHVDEGNWVEYNERYGFLKVSGQWKLARVAKEYTDDYLSRGDYLHGMAGSVAADLAPANAALLRDLQFGMGIEEVAAKEQVSPEGKEITLKHINVLRLPASATLSFKGGKLNQIVYILENIQSYYSAFISLYMRYSDPIELDDKGLMSWSTNDMQISLEKVDELYTITVMPYR